MEMSSWTQIYRDLLAQLNQVIAWLWITGVALWAGWVAIPRVFTNERRRFVERVYVAALVMTIVIITVAALLVFR